VVRLGYFDISDAELEPLFSEPVMLDSHFTVLASAVVGSFEAMTFVGASELNAPGLAEPAAAGSFTASIIFTPAANAAAADGKRCFIWAMNANTVSASTQHGIYSDHTWIMNSTRFGATQWDLSQVSAADAQDIILGHRGPQISPSMGGTILRMTNTAQLKLDLADTDKDGTPGLLEEAFAMDQAVADSQKLPKLSTRAGRPALTFTRQAGGTTASDGSYTAHGLRYSIEMSADLLTWLPCSAEEHPALNVTQNSDGTEQVSLALTPENVISGCQFARVRVERVQ
jgi:hypothetical protein